MSASGTVKAWVKAFNASDVEAITALYADDASAEAMYMGRADGKKTIGEKYAESFAFEGAELEKLAVVNLHEAGETAIVEWRDVRGLQGISVFDVADGRIASQRVYFDRLTANAHRGK